MAVGGVLTRGWVTVVAICPKGHWLKQVVPSLLTSGEPLGHCVQIVEPWGANPGGHTATQFKVGTIGTVVVEPCIVPVGQVGRQVTPSMSVTRSPIEVHGAQFPVAPEASPVEGLL